MPCCDDGTMIASGRMHVRLAGHNVPGRHMPRTGGSHMSNVVLAFGGRVKGWVMPTEKQKIRIRRTRALLINKNEEIRRPEESRKVCLVAVLILKVYVRWSNGVGG